MEKPAEPQTVEKAQERAQAPPPPPPDPVAEVRKHLMQSANLYILCVKAVEHAIAPHMPQVAQTSEQFQAAVSSLFIHATRWRLDEKMPARPL